MALSAPGRRGGGTDLARRAALARHPRPVSWLSIAIADCLRPPPASSAMRILERFQLAGAHRD
jgi:hypothetical protein